MGHRMEEAVSANPKNTRMKPATVLVYNSAMGALDDMDKIIRPYQSLRKTLKWYKKFAFHLIDVCIYNSFVLMYHKVASKPRYVDFLRSMVEEILAFNPKEQNCKRGRPATSTRSVSDENRLGMTLGHFPVKVVDEKGLGKPSDCYLCRLKGMRKTTVFECKVCKKRLCIGKGLSCFEQYHSISKLPSRVGL